MVMWTVNLISVACTPFARCYTKDFCMLMLLTFITTVDSYGAYFKTQKLRRRKSNLTGPPSSDTELAFGSARVRAAGVLPHTREPLMFVCRPVGEMTWIIHFRKFASFL